MSDLMDSIVHGLRMQGWSRIEAEAEALSRIERMRHSAQGIETRDGEKPQALSAKHESSVRDSECAQNPEGSNP